MIWCDVLGHFRRYGNKHIHTTYANSNHMQIKLQNVAQRTRSAPENALERPRRQAAACLSHRRGV